MRLGLYTSIVRSTLPPSSGGGAPTPWTPTDLGASLALWLDADDASTITLNGSTVSQWDDKSGNNHHVIQATSAAQPTYSATGFNNLPTVFFDASNDDMACATTTVSSQGDLFYGAVFQMLSDGSAWRPIVGTQISSNTNDAGNLLLQRMGSRSEIGTHDSGRVDTGSTYAVQVANLFEPRIATVGRSGGSNGNGGLITVTATGPSQPTYLTQAVQSWSTDPATTRIQIGGRQQNGTGWSNSNISEIVVCNRNLTTVERQKLEGYLAHKWGLVANLPSDHPYKINPPYAGEPVYDPDAQTYFNRVEGPTGDNQTLEASVKTAINNFVLGCKADGIWDAIKSSAILAGARTLSGALQPLAGTAPTNFNFVSGDYDRKTGLKGDGTTKYLDSNGTAATLTQQNSAHIAVYLSSATGPNNQGDSSLAGLIDTQTSGGWLWLRGDIQYAINNKSTVASTRAGLGLVGGSRSTNSAFTTRSRSISDTVSATSAPASNLRVCIFAIDQNNSIVDLSSSRLAFYSIGEALDLALLDTRITRFMAEMQFAINTGLNPNSYNIDTINYVNAGYAAGGTLA